MTDFDINAALRVYLGAEDSGGIRPYGMTERLQQEYGASAPMIEDAVRQILQSLADLPPAAQFESLSYIGDYVSECARAQHPELADDVCRAIGNYVSYSWR